MSEPRNVRTERRIVREPYWVADKRIPRKLKKLIRQGKAEERGGTYHWRDAWMDITRGELDLDFSKVRR